MHEEPQSASHCFGRDLKNINQEYHPLAHDILSKAVFLFPDLYH
jgi:hypothetical protein